MKLKYFYYLSFLLAIGICISACKNEYSIPEANLSFQNDCIKRSLGPNIVGGSNIEFAYAVAMGKGRGKIVSVEVEASIAGAAATYLENRSFRTDQSGADAGFKIGDPSINAGNKTSVTFNVDTNAATLRYFYAIPEAAKGKTVNFNFTAKNSNGETVSYQMGPYAVSNMDMKLRLIAVDGAASFISIEDMAVYNATAAAANPNKIDLVYLYRAITGITFAHALVAPTADPMYLPGLAVPTGVNKDTKILKVYGLQDRDLSGLQYGRYVDDLDFQQLDLSQANNFAINLKLDAGVWAATADGKYLAYVYVNAVNNTTKQMTLSIKRYKR